MAQVVIYITTYCPYCTAAKALLRSKNVTFEEIDVTNDPERRSEMEDRSQRRTVPQIYIGEKHVGGYEELAALDRAGKLEELLSN